MIKGRKRRIERHAKYFLFRQYFSKAAILSYSNKESISFYKAQERAFLELDSFVESVFSSSELPFQLERWFPSNNKGFIPENILNVYLGWVSSFIEVTGQLTPQIAYGEGINTFIAVLNSERLKSLREHWFINKGNKELGKFHDTDQKTAELFNILVEEIRIAWKSRKATLMLSNQIADANECYRDYCYYVDYQYDMYDCPIVLMFDFFYQSSYRNLVTVERAIQDFNRTIKNKRSNSAFHLMTGYIAKLFFYPNLGFSWSVIFFFDKEKKVHSSGIHLIEKIGNNWLFITEGYGDYFVDELLQSKYASLLPYTKSRRSISSSTIKSKMRYFCFIDIFFRPAAHPKAKLLRRGNCTSLAKTRR